MKEHKLARSSLSRPSSPRSTVHGPRSKSGFSLVELLTVITVIAILAGMVLGISGYASRKAAIAKAQAQMAKVKIGLENYRADWGEYPRTDSNATLVDLLYPQQVNQQTYVEFDAKELKNGSLRDPWGKAYEYRGSTPTQNPDTYDLWSYGPNIVNENGSGDDISNWRDSN